jgi:hypothetical protein
MRSGRRDLPFPVCFPPPRPVRCRTNLDCVRLLRLALGRSLSGGTVESAACPGRGEEGLRSSRACHDGGWCLLPDGLQLSPRRLLACLRASQPASLPACMHARREMNNSPLPRCPARTGPSQRHEPKNCDQGLARGGEPMGSAAHLHTSQPSFPFPASPTVRSPARQSTSTMDL